MIWCMWVRSGNILGCKVSTFRPASWLVPLLLSPAAWLQAVSWDNQVNSQNGTLGVNFTAVAGATLDPATQTLKITTPTPTTPGYATFQTALNSTTGWVRFNANANSPAKYEFAQLFNTGQALLGVGQGSYAALPASVPAPMQPSSPIASTVAAFTVTTGGVVTQQTGPAFNGGRIQNLLYCNGSNFAAYTTTTGASGDVGYNPLTLLATSPTLTATAFGPQDLSLVAWSDGAPNQTVAGQYVIVGSGTANLVSGSTLVTSGANSYTYYSNATVTAPASLNLAQGELQELQGALTIPGGLTATTLATVLMGGHGTSQNAGLTLANAASIGSNILLVVQEEPSRVFPITVPSGTATLSNQLTLVGGTQVSVSSGILGTLQNLSLWASSSLTSASSLSALSTKLDGSITVSSGLNAALGSVEVFGPNSSISAPGGNVTTTTLQTDQGGSLTLSASSFAPSGALTLNGSLALSATQPLTLTATTIGQGAQFSWNGPVNATIASLQSAAGGGVFSKAPVAGTVVVNTVTVSADNLSIVQNGTDLMTLGSTGGVVLGGGKTLSVSGSGNVSFNNLQGNGTLNLSGTVTGSTQPTRTFTGSVNPNGGILKIQTASANPLTIPAATTISIGAASGLGLQGPITFNPVLSLAAGQSLALSGGGVVVNSLTMNGGTLSVESSTNTINNLVLSAPAPTNGAGSLQLVAVSGANQLTASNATVILDGASSLGAGTKIKAGTIKLLGNPSLGAGSELIGDPTLEIAASLNQNLAPNQLQATNLLFSGSSRLSGSGAITTSTIQVNSPATVTMAGINLAATGATTIAAGASLGGVGTLTTTGVTVNGTLAAGDPVGTLNVIGPVTFGTNGIFVSTINAGGVGLLDVTGTATLAGNLDVTLTGTRAPIGTVYTVLKAASVSGTFAQAGGQAGLLTFEAIYTPTEVQVAVIYPPNGICSLVTPCSAAQAVGCAIDEIVAQQCYGPVFEDFLYNEVFYPVSSPSCVLQALSGGPYTDLPQMAGLQLLASQDVVRSAQWMALDRWDGCGRQYGWLYPTGDEISSVSWRFRAAGVQGGYEKIWSSGWGLGIMGMAEAVNFESKTCTMKGHGGNFGVTPVLSWVPSWRSQYWRSYVWASGTVSGLVTDLRRDISWTGFCCAATSDWNPINLSGRIEGGLSYQDCTMALQPFAALSAFKVGAGSIHEEACCPAGLDVGCWQESFGLAEIGFRWRDGLCWMNTTFAPELDMGVYALMWGRGSEMSAKFQEACCACWSLQGPSLSRYGAFGGFGLQGYSSDRLTIGMRVDGRFAKEYTAWIGTAQVMWRF